MRQFLILFDEIPIDKAKVKSGRNSSEVVTACRCVNVGLFVSGNLRRDVIVSIAKGSIDDIRIVSFLGESLKRVSPDERSISFFLLKSLNIAENLPQSSQQILDNGIIVTRNCFAGFISGYEPDLVFIVRGGNESILDSTFLHDDVIFIYDTRTNKDLAGSESMKMGDVKAYYIRPYPLHPERFILDINDLLDNAK